MFLQRLKVILLSGVSMSVISIIVESRDSLSAANFNLLPIYTLAYSCAFTIFAVPVQLLLSNTIFSKRFNILTLFIYILAALIVFFAINVSDFELNITFFTQILLYVYIISAGFFFWLWDSLIIPNKR
ncbi:TPA: UPF0715 family protein [Bacillus cereus]|uniref:UPF0715 family protein n=1 Tax=Bacillus TaxID=1386 RepID=UPI001398D6FE|nr:UPF0715 family protein [Bacillus sp. RB3]MBT2200770.1 UPF0715 family protein [Bacillus thuringiensis]MDM5370305.1 UPF0715 family protein [Bacillus bombysepticus]BCA36950.1 hypothetical protein BwiPL1_53320 [Bacillus wiedmannii]HDR8161311.1 UPF0715 family protein [Bacillus cereus]MDK3015165.1 UPF0715 family protein [Bacillus sp. RB3]